MSEKRKAGIARRFVLLSIRAVLVLLVLYGFIVERDLILVMGCLALGASFIPTLLEKYTPIRLPASSEVLIILAIYGVLYFLEIRGVYADTLIIGPAIQLAGGIILGMVGLTVMYALYQEKKVSGTPLLFALFTFCFVVSIAAVWEMFEFTLDRAFGFSLQGGQLTDTMGDLLFNGLGALIISLFGYSYVKQGKMYLLKSRIVERTIARNKKVFGGEEKNSVEEIHELRKKGESPTLEFKSSLRTNLHTREKDKRIEHAVLKTVVGYLNTQGGTVLVGVNDAGEIVGLNHDSFESIDAVSLHLTNMLKNHIGAEFLPFIDVATVEVDGKNVIKIACAKSQKEVFLKTEKGEEFYVRNGPSSTQLSGRALLEYVHNQFGKR